MFHALIIVPFYWCFPFWVYTPISIVYHNLFIHSYVDTHLGSSQFGLLQIELLRIFAYKSFWTYVFISHRCISGSGIAGSYCRLMLKFFRNCQNAFQIGHNHGTFPQAEHEISSCCTSLLTLDMVSFKIFVYSNGHVVVSQCGFLFPFPKD